MHFPSERTAIVGIGESKLGRLNRSPIQLCVDVALEAVADAGLSLRDIDGLMSMGVLAAEDGRDLHRHHVRVAEQLGLGPLTYTGTSKLGGGALGEVLRETAHFIEAGVVENVLVLGADAFRSGLGAVAAQGAWIDFHDNELEGPYGHTAPSHWAINAQRYGHRFGWDAETLEDALAHVAVSARKWAVLNPACRQTEELTLTQVRESKMVAPPMRVLHCSRSIDGGGAFVVTSAKHAESIGRHKPVYVAGVGTMFYQYYMPGFEDLTDTVYELSSASCNQALEAAGLSPSDIDVAYPYDGFAIMPLMALEAMQLAPRGEAVNLYREGATDPGGRLPCNTHGGALNHGLPAFPSRFFFVNEIVRQLRGEAGERQVPGAKSAFIHGWSGVGGINASAIFTSRN